MTATIAGQPDPFIGVLDSLGGAAATVGELNTPIVEVQEIVSVVANVLDDLDRLPTLLASIDELLVGLRGLLVLLDAVPFVDAAAAIGTDVVTVAQDLLADATETFTEVDESVIKPCKGAFDDLKLGLTDAQDVVHTISITVPGYVNTLEILHFMAEIAAPLTEILKGSKPADDLRNLLDTLDGVEEDVGTALKPLSDFLNGMQSVVSDISHSLDTVFHDMQGAMQGVEADLQAVEGIFSPVVDAFNAVADAIRPIRWALDAISWIFDHVCEPILTSILDATGLNTLLDELKSEVEQKLGIKPIIDLVTSNLSSQAAAGWQQQGGAQAAGSGQSAWNTLSGVLEQYNTRDSGGFRNDVDLLISALAGTPIKPDTPALIPDWPDQPGLQVPTVDPSPRSVGAAANVSTLAMPLQQTLRGMRLAQGFQALAAIPSNAPPTPRLDVPGLLARTATPGGVPSLDALRSLATQVRGDLADAATLGPRMVADLQSYDAARTLPGDFYQSMQDVSDLLNDGVRILDFVEQFGFLTALIEDLKAPLAAQASAVDGIVEACRALAQSGEVMDGVIGQVVAAVPSPGVFTAALDYMDRVALGAATLSSAMARARGLDAQLNNAHKADLDDLQSQLDASAGAVTDQTAKVEQLARAALAAGAAVLTTLEDYAAALGRLGGDAVVISSDTLPNVGRAVHLLNILASILDPLSGLLQKLDCVDGGDPAKAGAAAVIATFRTTATTTINGQDQVLQGLLGAALSGVLHTGRMSADIAAINALVQKEQAAFDQARSDLATALAALPAAMKPAQAFPSTDRAGRPITVDNLFVDPSFASRAQAVFNTLQTASGVQAGAQPDPDVPVPPGTFHPQTTRVTMTDASNPNQAQIGIWTGYTHYLAAADGLLRTTEGLVKNYLNADTFQKVGGAIVVAHLALQGVDKQLTESINAMKEGKAPEYVFEPSPIPDWPKEFGSVDVFSGAWESIKAALEQMMGKTTPSSLLGIAIAGLIAKGDDIVTALEQAFD